MGDNKIIKKHENKKTWKKAIREKKGLLTKKSLHGAIRGLLNDVKREKSLRPTSASTSLLPKHKKPLNPAIENKSPKRRTRRKIDPAVEYTEKNGIIYIKSKENKMIRKLTDDEVMARHKRADQTMKDVWTKIIDKYGTVQDQGDILDLQTGEIIEDHGHLRGENPLLPSVYETVTNYKTSLNDILLQDESQPVEDRTTNNRDKHNAREDGDISIWNDEDIEEEDRYKRKDDEEEDV